MSSAIDARPADAAAPGSAESVIPDFLRRNTEERAALLDRLRDSLREGDLAFGGSSPLASVGEWKLEPAPLLLGAGEWSRIEAAVMQRSRLVNLLLEDIYGGQQTLKQRILPPELVLADPFFRRPCKGIPLGDRPRATILRCDLIRGPGGWMHLQTHTNTPLGMFLAVQNRRLMAQEADGLYARLPPFHSVIDLPLALLESLRTLAPASPAPPSVILLSSGPSDPYFAEHGFLARKMGIPLAQGDDLIVLDGRLYFKSIEGLEPVDVIYRRLHDGHIDPVTFATDRNTAGVAGLLPCIRAGSVSVANAIGAGFAENRGLEAYTTRLCRFLLGEKPVLPSLTTYYCGDRDQMAHVLDNADELDVLPVHDTLPGHPIIGSQVRGLGARDALRLMRQHPTLFAAQGRSEIGQHPVFAEEGVSSRPLRLSVFACVSSEGVRVIPGGLAVLGVRPGERWTTGLAIDPSLDGAGARAGEDIADAAPVAIARRFPLAIGTCCDVVVLRAPEEQESGEAEPPNLRPRSLVLGSRAAENLFWLGRYAERAENTARMVALMSDVGLEDIASSDRERWFARWSGFLEATGHSLHGKKSAHQSVSEHLVLDTTNPSSVVTAVELIWENARRARDFLSPECWRIVSRLRTRVQSLAQPQKGRAPARGAADQAVDEVLTLLPAVHGTIERTMPVDSGTRFLRTGIRLERCVTTAAALRQTFAEAEAERLPAHTSHPQLGAVVRLLCSQDAFRRAYQAPATPALVAEFFLRNRESPQSIENGLAFLTEQLELIGGDLAFPESPPRLAGHHLRFVRDIPIERTFDAGDSIGPLSAQMEELLSRLFALSDAIGDFYMNHQARFCA